MKMRAEYAIAGMLVVMVAVIAYAHRRDQRGAERVGRLIADTLRLADELADARRAMARVDSVYVVDTARVTRTHTRYLTRVDSLRVTDTLTVRERVIVAAADTALRACRDALTTCEQRVAARDSMIALMTAQRATVARLYEARLRQVSPRVVPYAEAVTNPFDTRTVALRGGIDLRLVSPFRAIGTVEYRTQATTPVAVVVGLRMTF